MKNFNLEETQKAAKELEDALYLVSSYLSDIEAPIKRPPDLTECWSQIRDLCEKQFIRKTRGIVVEDFGSIRV